MLMIQLAVCVGVMLDYVHPSSVRFLSTRMCAGCILRLRSCEQKKEKKEKRISNKKYETNIHLKIRLKLYCLQQNLIFHLYYLFYALIFALYIFFECSVKSEAFH